MRANPAGLVTILANAECPHCVHATDTLTDWCCEAGLPVAGVDLAHHPEAGTAWGIERSPSLVYSAADGRPRLFAGFPTRAQFQRLTRA